MLAPNHARDLGSPRCASLWEQKQVLFPWEERKSDGEGVVLDGVVSSHRDGDGTDLNSMLGEFQKVPEWVSMLKGKSGHTEDRS